MKVKIEIDTKTFIRFWLVIFGFLLAGWAIFLAKDALILVVISLFLALALNNSVSKIAKILPGSKKNRVGATAAAYILIVAFLGTASMIIIPTVAEQTNKFVAGIPQLVESATSQNGAIRTFIRQNNLEELVNQASNSAKQIVDDYSKNFGNIIFGSLNTMISFIVSLFLILTMTFLMLVEGPSWLDRIWRLYPDVAKQKRHKKIATKMYRAVSAFVNGQLTISAISGVCGGLMIVILSFLTGIPMSLAIPVGVILFVVGTIPMFGALVAGLISSLIVALNSWYAGLFFLTYFLIYQQTENSVIAPMIQAKSNKLSALLIIVSITIGIYVFGILGAFLSIPLAACAKIIFEEVFLARRKKRPSEDKNSIVEFLKNIK